MSTEKQKTILLVEDEVITAMAEKMVLEKFEYKVITANTGEEAVAAVEKSPAIDLILMDIDLGTGMDGTETAAAILKKRDLPVVFLSSHMEPEIVAKTEKITSYGYVVKNSSNTILVASIKMAFKLFEAKIKEKEKEEALRESEASYRVLFSGASDGILLADAQTMQFHYANPAICRMLGYTEEEFMRLSAADIHPKESLDRVLAELAALAQGAIVSSADFPCLRKDGTLFYANISHSAMVMEGREYHAGFFHDITERKQTERALHESENRLKDIIFSMADWVWEVDTNGVYTYSSNKGLDLFGASRGDIIGKTPFDFMPAEEVKRVGAIYSEIVANKMPIKDLENWSISKNGERICLLTNGVPILDEKGNLKGYRGVDKDITERKQAESQKEAALEALRESEEWNKAILQTVLSGVMVIEVATRKIVEVNDTALKLIGLPKEQVIGAVCHQFVCPAEEKSCPVLDLGQDVDLSEKILLTALGKRKNIIKTVVPVQWHGRKYLMESFVDITERKRAETIQQIQYTIANAMIKAETLSDFLETVRSELSSLIDTTNFLLALYDEASGMFSAPFEKDEKDAIPQWPAEKSLTGLVIRQKRSMLLSREQTLQMFEAGTIELIGTTAESWLGVPLQINEKILGAIVVQSYDNADAYDQSSVNLMEMTASQLSVYIERKQAAEALRESDEAFKGYFNVGTVGMCVTSPEKGWIEVNDCLCRMLGYSREELLRMTWAEMTHPDDLNADLNLFNQVLAGQRDSYELDKRFIRKDGQVIYTVLYVTCQRKPDGTVHHILASLIDISERKRAEGEIKRQLAEKEFLLKEVHHRIKNNIASIASLISLRLQSVTNPEAVAVLQDAIGRVDSMRILYDKLLLSEDYGDVSVKSYVESLINTVITLFPDNTKVKIDKHIDDFTLDPKRLFPLGIIINELITNKMKYAFCGKKAGTIKISLTHVGHHVTLIIQDNGVGLPAGFDVKESKGFGLMLVKMLSQQLGGSFSIAKHEGTRCTVEFNI